jgi:prephenate dehydratase
MQKTIAIQGYEGSFHQEAAELFFGQDIKVHPCATFKDLIKASSHKQTTDAGMMAIENSIAGSILPNYNLLLHSKLQIVGEVYLQIQQQLLVNKEVELTDIKEVHSHPMALLQCGTFLDKHHFKLVESEDTALSAKLIAQRKSKHNAAIASKTAAKLYGLKIIAPNIQSAKDNYTRFLVIERNEKQQTVAEANKASVYFLTDHSKGSLAKVLSTIADNDINLSKLQSMPVPGSKFKYGFHADMEFANLQQFEKVKTAMQTQTNELKILGIYKNGK